MSRTWFLEYKSKWIVSADVMTEPYVLVDLTIQNASGLAFCCPSCQIQFNIETAQQEANTSGLSFALCDWVIFQVVQCHNPGCPSRVVFRSYVNNPALNMQGMLLMPYKMHPIEQHEQAFMQNPPYNWPDRLKFQLTRGHHSYACVKMDEQIFWEELEKERRSGKIHLKRLYPNEPYYNALFCLFPDLQTGFEDDKFDFIHDHISTIGDHSLTKAVLTLLRAYTGNSIYKEVVNKLIEKGYMQKLNHSRSGSMIGDVSYLAVQQLIEREISQNHFSLINQFYKIISDLNQNYKQQAASVFLNLYHKLFHSVCSDFYLSSRRSELSKWIDKVQKGTALFVDAPMGLGKTYSIVETLSRRQDLSAIVFFPTRRLCDEFCLNLTKKIAEINQDPPKTEEGRVIDIVSLPDKDGRFYSKGTRDYLERNGVYYLDGINEHECSSFEQVIKKYSKKFFSKGDVCRDCDERSNCRFLQHAERAPLHRIIVATHAMYDQIFDNHESYGWKKGERFVQRDMFIVDEDIVFSKCYQPISLNEDELRDFVATITNFLNDPDYFDTQPIKPDVFIKIDSILGQFVKCDTISYIPPIDHKFSLPVHVKEKWDNHRGELSEVIPDTINVSSSIGNYLEIIENCIRKGFVVQKYNTYDENGLIKKVFKRIYLPNPKVFRFDKKTPAHVFFDGTMFDEDLLKNKMLNVEFDKIELPIYDSFWDLRAWQNINTDLPKYKVPKNADKVKSLLGQLLPEIGFQNRFLILSSKDLRAQLEPWIKEQYPGLQFVMEHYGNLRGMNSAKDCNIAFVLGGYILSDAVEITIAIDFIYKKFIGCNPVPIKTSGNLWSWQGPLGVRKYKDEYEIVGDLAKKYRYAEYRQALARTRYLFHPVDFYILSKDRLTDYEPFVKATEEHQMMNIIFPPRPKREDNRDTEIKNVVIDWLKTNPSVSATEIASLCRDNKGKTFRRQTVGKVLREMLDHGTLTYYRHYKKKYMSNMNY